MTNTNQLIEEKAKIQFRKLWSSITKDNQHLTTEKIEDLIINIISQTEQKCDKKWRTLIESKRDGKDCNNCGQCIYCQDDYTIGYNQCIDDLLNNK